MDPAVVADARLLVSRGVDVDDVSRATGVPVDDLRPYAIPRDIADAMRRDDDSLVAHMVTLAELAGCVDAIVAEAVRLRQSLYPLYEYEHVGYLNAAEAIVTRFPELRAHLRAETLAELPPAPTDTRS